MYRTLKITLDSGNINTIFLSDADSGNTAKDILTVPGVFEELQTKNNTSLKFTHISGAIGAYRTVMFALVVEDTFNTEDITEDIAKYLTMPDTAAKMMLRAIPDEDKQELISESMELIHYYEAIQESSKLCIPQSAFIGMTAEQTEKMLSHRKSYVLKNTDNQEIFQSNYDTDYCVLLPSLEEIHSGVSDLVSTIDILRVIAPYRKQERQGVFSYYGIYHTPYYKVDKQLKGMVPSYLSWINGYSVDDMLDIQDNERHMANNLKMLICSDISRYVSELVSGVFLDSPLGSLLAKLCVKKDSDVLNQLLEDIGACNNDDASCAIPYNEIDELTRNGWYPSDVVNVIKKNFKFSDDYLYNLISQRPVDRRVIDSDNLAFVLQISDQQEQQFTDLMISMGYISVAMQRFLLDLCKKAYRVNWGHTGATMAIPGFASLQKISDVNKAVSDYLVDCSSGQLPEPERYSILYVLHTQNTESEDTVLINSTEEADDDPSVGLNYYVTADTAQKIKMGLLPFDYFFTPASAAQTTESSVVEYWRNVNGEANLDNFLSSSLLRTADVSILIESFIKLMRWGMRKPKLLVLQNHPEIRHVFDMGTGLRVDNTAIVDESELVKYNGCDYSLVGFLCSNSNPTLRPDQVIGFKLCKDYGSVKKTHLASWLDLGEMIHSGDIKIGDFVAMNKLEISQDTIEFIEDYSKLEHDFYVSDENISEGLKSKIQPKDLNALILLTTPAVMNSREYLRSLKGDTIITTKDRQYDILRRYVAIVNKVYSQRDDITRITNTMELGVLAEEFYNLYKAQGDGKQDSNTAVSASTLKTLNLGDINSSIVWDTSEISGKFILISDREMESDLPPIEFTNPQLQAVAAKTNNRIVMLLLPTDKKYIFCRKDITPDQVMLVSSTDSQGKAHKTVANKSYKSLAPLIKNLTKGVSSTINNQLAVLHETLKDYI